MVSRNIGLGRCGAKDALSTFSVSFYGIPTMVCNMKHTIHWESLMTMWPKKSQNIYNPTSKKHCAASL